VLKAMAGSMPELGTAESRHKSQDAIFTAVGSYVHLKQNASRRRTGIIITPAAALADGAVTEALEIIHEESFKKRAAGETGSFTSDTDAVRTAQCRSPNSVFEMSIADSFRTHGAPPVEGVPIVQSVEDVTYGDRLTFVSDANRRPSGDTDESQSSRSTGPSEECPKGQLEGQLELSRLKCLGFLGKGAAGHVVLMIHSTTREVFALKSMEKRRYVLAKATQRVLNEVELLRSCDHPFIVRVHATFQDSSMLHMLTEPALGGELHRLLDSNGALPVSSARFYAASIISALIHCHDRRIAYRDMKLENVLLDAAGFVKLIDFGFAKRLSGDRKSERTFTVVGTPEYLAPEIIVRAGHSFAVDFWALGVLLYELLVDEEPFTGTDPLSLYRSILRGHVAFPESAKLPKSAKDVIRHSLLVTDPVARVSEGRVLAEHKFFSPLSLTKLEALEITPPWIPALVSEADRQYFDDADLDGDATPTPCAEGEPPLSEEDQKLFTAFGVWDTTCELPLSALDC